MRSSPFARVAALVAAVVLAGVAGFAQATATLKVYVTVIDAELNVKPVPRHVLLVRSPNGGGDIARIVTGFDGRVEIKLPPGAYSLESEKAVVFQGHSYRWKQIVAVADGAPGVVELSTDNALDAAAATPAPARAGGPPTPADAPAAKAAGPVDLHGAWDGKYAGSPAELKLDEGDAGTWSGLLAVTVRKGKDPVKIQVAFRLTDSTVELRELSILDPGAVSGWKLGTGSGTIQADGKAMSGTGKDESKKSFKWEFTRK